MRTSCVRPIFLLAVVVTIGCGGSSPPAHAPDSDQPIGLTPSPPDTATTETPAPSATEAAADDSPPTPVENDGAPQDNPPTTMAVVQVGAAAPDMNVDPLGAAKVPKMAVLAGKTVVVHFWASWCAPCKKEMADLDALAAKHKKDLVVIGVSVDDDKKSAEAFLSANKVKFANGFDAAKATAKAWNLQTMPTTFVVDKKGNLSAILQGAHPDDVTSIAKQL